MHSPPSDFLAARQTDDQFSRLFQKAFRKLWCIAAGIVGNAATAEDVVQDAALIALKKFDQFQNPRLSAPQAGAALPDGLPAFTAWMAQIVRFVALTTPATIHLTSTIAHAAA